LIVAAFQDEDAADEALKKLKTAQKQKLIDIQDAAVIRRDENNKLHIKETADPGGGRGAAAGGAIGAVIGLIAGPPGVVVGAAAGALVGGVTAKVIDSGIPDDRLKQIGEGLQPGTSAIVAIIEHSWVEDVEKQLTDSGADVLTESIRADIAEQLQAGREVSYTTLTTDEGVASQRTVTGEDQIEVDSIISTEDGVAGSVVVATEEGVVAEGFIATEEGVVTGVAIAASVEDSEAETEEADDGADEEADEVADEAADEGTEMPSA
jgi:uncharacterized membrane protein